MQLSDYTYLILAVALFFAIVRFLRYSSNRAELTEFAKELGFSVHPVGTPVMPQELLKLPYFDTVMVLNIRNLFEGKLGDTTVLLYLDWGSGEDPPRRFILCLFSEKWNLPDLELSAESRIIRAISQLGQSKVDFPEYPQFSKHYWVRGDDISAIRSLLGPAVLAFLAAHPGWYMGGKGHGMLMYRDKGFFERDSDVVFLRKSWREIMPLCQSFQEAGKTADTIKDATQ